jgi:hypothetical protein
MFASKIHFLISCVSFNHRCHQSTKRKRLKVHLGPLVGFVVLNDNLIKGLMSSMSRFQTNNVQMCHMDISLDVNLRCKWNQMITQ